MKLDVLAFGAHPDDVELSCGGTLAKLSAQGKKIGIIDLTRGELGTRGTPEIRFEESELAKNILGIQIRENLGFYDGFIQNNKDSKRLVINKIRQYQPDIIFANAFADRHPDHNKGADMVSIAAYLSGLPKIETPGYSAWRPHQVYHYIQWNEVTPDFVFDISGYLDTKLKACLAYQSQFYDPNSEEPQTPISTQNFLESITQRNKNLGRLTGVDAAEGFTTQKMVTLKTYEALLGK